MCTCLALSAIAGVTRPDAVRARQALYKSNHAAVVPAAAKPQKSASLQQFMRERQLTPGDNRLTSRAPRRLSVEDFLGMRVTSVSMYDFNGFDDNGYPVYNDSVYGMGWGGELSYNQDSALYCLDTFLGAYVLPLVVDLENNKAWIWSCFLSEDTLTDQISGSRRTVTTSTNVLYTEADFFSDDNSDFVPLEGEISPDGSIMFEGGCFVYTEVVTKKYRRSYSTWVLSSTDTEAYVTPLISGISMMVPNGIHEYVVNETPSGPTLPHLVNTVNSAAMLVGDLLIGGYDINGNGKGKKPIDPRTPTRSGTIDGSGMKTSLLGLSLESLSHISFDSLFHFSSFSIFPDGGGRGYKPIDPRNPGQGNTKTKFSGRFTDDGDGTWSPVYMFQHDDSTLVVVNLYNMGETMNIMYINEDGTVNFPGQELFYDAQHENVIYNYTESGDSLLAGNTGQVLNSTTLQWGTTTLYGKKGYYPNYCTDNVLIFGDGGKFLVGKAQMPVINVELTDDAVTFTAVSEEEGVEIHMWMSDGVYNIDVPNPYVVARTEVEQPLTLFAYADAFNIGKNNSDVFLGEYVIPISVLRGDVNNNRDVSISDVTALINHLLTGELTSGQTFNAEAADVNRDGHITINDVTALVNFLLTR